MPQHTILPQPAIAEPATVTIDMPLVSMEEQGVIIVHCRFEGQGAIRVWQSTFLLDRGSNHRSKLLHVENITLYPVWTFLEGSGISFTLYFEALPGSCKLFDLHEIIPQQGGFFVQGIARNNEDVYRVVIV